MLPKFPIYIVSKGRFEKQITSNVLDVIGIKHYVVVEQQEFFQYAGHANPSAEVIILDKKYQEAYDAFDDLGMTKSKGPGPARNFVWDHSIAQGHKWHWVMDDNIKGFYRLYNNVKRPAVTPGIFAAMEEFCLRYTNVAMAGPHYFMFANAKTELPPFYMNTRVYSCNLIRNDTPFRWRGRYNEDTDLSIRMLKEGWCTVVFVAFLADKVTTQYIKGGNTDEFYAKEGTMPKSEMLAKMHPEISRVTWRFGRWHHYVDYSGFTQKLKWKDEIERPKGPNEFGMKLVSTPWPGWHSYEARVE